MQTRDINGHRAQSMATPVQNVHALESVSHRSGHACLLSDNILNSWFVFNCAAPYLYMLVFVLFFLFVCWCV